MRFVRLLVKAYHIIKKYVLHFFGGKEVSEVRDTESCVEMKCFESRRMEF